MFEFFLGLLAVAYLALPLVSFVLSLSTRTRLRQAQEETASLRTEFNGLEIQLRRRIVSLEERLAAAEGAGIPPGMPAEMQGPRQAAQAPPAPAEVSKAAEKQLPVLFPETAPPSPPGPLPEAMPQAHVAGHVVKPPVPPVFVFPPPPPNALPAEVAAPVRPVEPFGPGEVTPPPPPAPMPSPIPYAELPRPLRHVPLPPPPPPVPSFDWEGIVGVKLFSWIAGIALVIAAVSFIRYSYERITPVQKLAGGITLGIAMLAICERKAARKYPATANALDGAAIALLFSVFFAAGARWNVMPIGASFVMMALVAATGVLLSIRRDSIYIALLGLLGGFATPLLLSTGEDRPLALFSYLAMINAGLSWVAHKKRWPILSLVSVIFTALYQWGWVAKFLNEGKVPLALGIFIVFPLLSFAAIFFGENEETARDSSFKAFTAAGKFAAAVPLLFALFLASVPAYGSRYGLLFGFLLLLAAGLSAVSIWLEEGGLHLAGAASSFLVFAIWTVTSYRSTSWPLFLGFVAVFVLFFLGVPLVAEKLGRPLSAMGQPSVIASPAILLVFPVLAWKEAATATPFLLTAALLVLLGTIAYYAAHRSEPSLYILGSVFAFATLTIWSYKHLDEGSRNPALIVYAAVALFFLGAALLGNAIAESKEPWRRMLFFSLAAYPFLIYITGSSELAIPISGWMTALFIVVIASLGAAISTRSGPFWVAVAVASQLVLLMFSGGPATASPAAILTSLVFSALALVMVPGLVLPWEHLSERKVSFTAAGFTSVLFAQFLVAFEATTPGDQPFELILAAQLVLVAALLGTSLVTGWHGAAIISAVPAYLTVLFYHEYGGPGTEEVWDERLVMASLVFLLYLTYAWIAAAKAKEASKPFVATLLASSFLFLLGRQALIDGGYQNITGLLPVLEAGALALLVFRLLKLHPPGQRALAQLALAAGGALAFITVAIPVQLEKEWITIGWALEGAALAWLFTRVPHRGLLLASAGLLAVVFVRLSVNPAVLSYHERTGTPVFNWYLYTYLVPALAMFAATWFLRKTADRLTEDLPRTSSVTPALGTLLLFWLVNIQIADYFSTGSALTFNFTRGASFAQDVAYTLAWAVFAIGILAAGVILDNKATRIASIGLLVLTILKAFLRDLPRLGLGGLYLPISLAGLAVSLILVAVAIQKFVLSKKAGPS